MKKPLLVVLVLTSAIFASCASDRPVLLVRETAVDFEELAREHYNRADYRNAVLYFEKALRENQKINNEPGMAKNMYNIARCYINLGLPENAQKLIGEAITLNEHGGDMSGLGDDYSLLGSIRIREKEYDKARELLMKSYDYYLSGKNSAGAATVLNNLGTLDIKNGEYEQARKRIEQSINIHRKNRNHLGLAASYSNLGYLFELTDNKERAVEQYLLALQEDKYVENSIGISNDLNILAAFYENNGDFENALYYYRRALEVNRNLGFVDRQREDLDNIINLLGSMGRIRERETYLRALEELEKRK
jgi:tetratricopeptide (TPR) repeat protein